MTVAKRGRRARAWLAGALVGALSCESSAPSPPSDPAREALDRLRAFEAAERSRTDFSSLPAWDELRGPEPYALAHAGERLVGVLSGSSELVLLGPDARELDRVEAPRAPAALAVAGDEVLVVSELASELARYRIDGDRLVRLDGAPLLGVLGARGVALGPEGVVYVVEELGDRLLVASLEDGELLHEERVCAGPIEVARAGPHLVIDCLLDHSIVVRRVDARGVPVEAEARIVHDGPIWSMAARAEGEGLLLALGGVEDHPLDRRPGFFGYVDSFVFAYRVADGRVERVAAMNVADRGVVTPKALAWLDDERLVVTGYGGERAVELRLADGRFEVLHERALPPGTRAVVARPDGTLIAANPLLDAWVIASAQSTKVEPIAGGPRPAEHQAEIRLGEALFFTTLMAPENPNDGAHSRFSCETCHFEGYVDGRTHHTGREDIRATTKPLLGLFNNKPHFTRALDPNLTVVAHAEFRVAGQGSGHDPWFALDRSERPWLSAPGSAERIGPEALRKALMRFLMSFTHRPNPRVLGRDRFEPAEQRGAALFRDRCAGCHAARLSADDPATLVPFDRWESLVLDERGPIVWASDGYRKTGVEPYVHPEGARTVSLRRLYKKRPYFTNGSAAMLEEVLSRARFDGERFWHDRAPQDARALSADERQALLAFLRLL